MADEPAKVSLDDNAIAATKRKRRFFSRRRESETSALTNCENCGAPLTGHYCAQCGQPAVDYRRSFRHVIGDILETFDIHSKIFGTAGLLVTRPWALTNEYLSGKRVRHLNPFKLYLFASVGFFLLVHYWTKDLDFHSGKVSDKDRAKAVAELQKERPEIDANLKKANLSAETRRKVQQTLDGLASASSVPTESPQNVASPSPTATETKASPTPAEADEGDYGPIQLDDKAATPFEKWLEAKAKEKVGVHGSKFGLFFATLLQIFPYMILCCIPLFALVLKLLYIRRGVSYIEHLIYALHIHTFAFVGITVIVFATQGLDHLAPSMTGWIAVLWVIFAAQILLSIRRVYRQGWFFSVLKFFIGGVVYFSVLLFALIATIIIYFSMP